MLIGHEATHRDQRKKHDEVLIREFPLTSQIFGLMLSDSGHVSRRKTARFNVLRIILFFVDWLQLAAIMMSPSTGYTFS